MSYIVQVPSSFLVVRWVQIGLAIASAAVDIANIALTSSFNNSHDNFDGDFTVVTYGPSGYGIWLVRGRLLPTFDLMLNLVSRLFSQLWLLELASL
jgi:hypothetical protein